MWLSVSLVWLRNYFSDESTSWRKLVGILEEFLSVEHVGAIWWPYLFTVKIEIVDHAPFVCRIVSKAEIALSNSIICSMYRVCEWKVYNCWTFFGFMIFDALVIGGIVRHSWDLWCLIDKLLLNKLQNSTAFLEWRSKLNLNTFFFIWRNISIPPTELVIGSAKMLIFFSHPPSTKHQFERSVASDIKEIVHVLPPVNRIPYKPCPYWWHFFRLK